MSIKKKLLLAIVALLLLGIVLAVGAWGLVRVRPGWYQPRPLDRDELLVAEQQMNRGSEP